MNFSPDRFLYNFRRKTVFSDHKKRARRSRTNCVLPFSSRKNYRPQNSLHTNSKQFPFSISLFLSQAEHASTPLHQIHPTPMLSYSTTPFETVDGRSEYLSVDHSLLNSPVANQSAAAHRLAQPRLFSAAAATEAKLLPSQPKIVHRASLFRSPNHLSPSASQSHSSKPHQQQQQGEDVPDEQRTNPLSYVDVFQEDANPTPMSHSSGFSYVDLSGEPSNNRKSGTQDEESPSSRGRRVDRPFLSSPTIVHVHEEGGSDVPQCHNRNPLSVDSPPGAVNTTQLPPSSSDDRLSSSSSPLAPAPPIQPSNTTVVLPRRNVAAAESLEHDDPVLASVLGAVGRPSKPLTTTTTTPIGQVRSVSMRSSHPASPTAAAAASSSPRSGSPRACSEEQLHNVREHQTSIATLALADFVKNNLDRASAAPSTHLSHPQQQQEFYARGPSPQQPSLSSSSSVAPIDPLHRALGTQRTLPLYTTLRPPVLTASSVAQYPPAARLEEPQAALPRTSSSSTEAPFVPVVPLRRDLTSPTPQRPPNYEDDPTQPQAQQQLLLRPSSLSLASSYQDPYPRFPSAVVIASPRTGYPLRIEHDLRDDRPIPQYQRVTSPERPYPYGNLQWTPEQGTRYTTYQDRAASPMRGQYLGVGRTAAAQAAMVQQPATLATTVMAGKRWLSPSVNSNKGNWL